jgi:heptosyltransferase-3
LRFSESLMVSWHEPGDFLNRSYCVIHAHTRWPRKSWPMENWERLVEALLEFTPGIVLSCGPDAGEIEASRRLCEKFGARMRSTLGRASWTQLAWLLKNAAFFAGVDTAAMHLAAACHCPTVALFGPSPAFEYHPWKTPHWMIRPIDWPGEDEAKKMPPQKWMERIPVENVLAACREAWTRKTDRA